MQRGRGVCCQPLKSSQMNRSILFLLIAGVSVGIFSCKKSAQRAQASIIGQWDLINDSSSFVGQDPSTSYRSNYIGQPGDYFIFSVAGNLLTKEGNLLDTMAYEILPNGQVQCVPSPGSNQTYTSSDITAATASFTIIQPKPTGQLTKFIHLRR
jgi:hypothetical protein